MAGIPVMILIQLLIGLIWIDFGSADVPPPPKDIGKIRAYVTKLLEEERQFLGEPLDVAPILSRYTTGDLIKVARLQITLAENSATISHEATCDIANQEELDELNEHQDHKAINYREVQKFMTSLSKNGKKYCNFFAYLRCKHDPGRTHKCLCPKSMVWQGDRCVFREGETCYIVSGFIVHPVFKVDGDYRFMTWDFLRHKYTLYIAPKCEGPGVLCTTTSGDSICGANTFKEYATVAQLSEFLESNIKEGTGSLKTEFIRQALKDITQPQRLGDYYFLSLEYQMTQRLLKHGATCDYIQDQAFVKLAKTYGTMEDTYFSQTNYYDQFRRQFQRNVLEAFAKICNHFEFLHCKLAATGSSTCACKDDFQFDGTNCRVSREKACREKKVFHIQFSVDTGGDFDPTYFKIQKVDCQAGSMCITIGTPGTPLPVCLTEEDVVQAQELQENFIKKFSLELNAGCDADEQHQLIKIGSEIMSFPSFTEIKERIQSFVSKSSVQYCKILKHATCTGSKCSCISPSVPSNGICTIAANEKCDSASQKPLQQHHAALDKLILPLQTTDKTTAIWGPVCPESTSCRTDASITELSLCICSPGKIGDFCELEHNKYVKLINGLPEDLKTPEGRKLVSKLHTALHKLESKMTLEYGGVCNQESHKKLAVVMDYFTLLYDDCSQYISGAPCPQIFRAKLEDVLEKTNELTGVTTNQFCDWEQRIRCLNGECGCPENTFHFEGKGCLVELGDKCKDDNHFTVDYQCREGTKCDGICIVSITGIHVNHRPNSELLTASVYVARVRAALVEYFKAREKDLKLMQSILPNEKCKYNYEVEFKKIKSLMDPAMDYVKSNSGSLSDQRQHIRILGQVVEKLKSEVRDWRISVCVVNSKCDPVKGKCTGGRTNPNPNPESAGAGLAQILPVNFYVISISGYFSFVAFGTII